MKIPVTVVTGFLGAGKTSLIRHILENSVDRRIALIINEFGDLGIDREMLLGCSSDSCTAGDMVELANGCICCTVADEFLPTMEALLSRPSPPDHILIETSGLALPKPLVKAFNWPEVRSKVTVDGVITVIDAPAVAAGRFADDPQAINAERMADAALDHEQPLEEVFGDQLACADLVVVNKTDVLDQTALAAVRDEISAHLRPGVKMVSSVHGAVPLAVVLGLAAGVEEVIEDRPSCHDGEADHDHDDFTTFIVSLGTIDDPAGLEERIALASANHDILRIKGFVDVLGKDMRHVIQGVGARIQRYYDRPWQSPDERHSRLVVIGQKGIDQAAVRLALDAL